MLARTLALTFHGIGAPIVSQAPGEGRYFVTEDIFRDTIRSLAGLEAKSGVKIRITFDDGNLSDHAVGLPTLLQNGRTARFFVLAGRIEKIGYLSGTQLREMVAAGMSIGTHGWDHVDWSVLDEAGQRKGTIDARCKIEDEAGCAVREATIPFGRFDKALLAHLKQCDYDRIYTSSGELSCDGAWFCPR
ncbi:polysaccharide deacetylase family protein [Breoghania sp.]|uniref:polysaccharide deacetylase family protein n=1 Tax=Breoghania sp. TaxID=2065378 RepID=UPI00260BE7E7|nr:polysaccharide deacetylase family protein [Breoghania sp.]MDJ0930983.1 polysaccharide deacetylase family protein [Breoghania sp.]